MRTMCAIAALLALTGCSSLRRMFVKQATISVVGTSPISGLAAPVKVTNPDNAAQPATLKSNEAVTDVSIDAGTKIVTPITINGVETTATIELPPLHLSKRELVTQASSSQPDRSVALHQIDAEENRVLLYAALGCAALGIFFMWRAYPTPAIACGACAVVFFLAWKIAGMPWWTWVLALVGAGIAGGIYWGYERHEKETAAKK